MKLKNYLLVGMAALLLGSGCGKKKDAISLLPPDPAECATMSLDVSGNNYDENLLQLTRSGCVRKLSQEWGVPPDFNANHLKFLVASIAGDADEVGRLISSGIDVNANFYADNRSIYDYALSFAVGYGHLDVVRELLKDNASVKKLVETENPLTLIEVRLGAFLRIEQSEKKDRAVIETIQAFVKNGFDVNAHGGQCKQNSFWVFPRARNRSRITEELKKLGYQVTQQDKDYALWMAALLKGKDHPGDMDVVKELVREGANVNARAGCTGKKIYEIVKEKGTPEMIALFKQLGAKD